MEKEQYKTEKEFWNQFKDGQPIAMDMPALLLKFKQHLIDTGEMVPAEKWISVKDRLPEIRTYVLISYWSGYDIAEFKHGCFFVGLNRITDVEYWQEITAPGEHNTKS